MRRIIDMILDHAKEVDTIISAYNNFCDQDPDPYNDDPHNDPAKFCSKLSKRLLKPPFDIPQELLGEILSQEGRIKQIGSVWLPPPVTEWARDNWFKAQREKYASKKEYEWETLCKDFENELDKSEVKDYLLDLGYHHVSLKGKSKRDMCKMLAKIYWQESPYIV